MTIVEKLRSTLKEAMKSGNTELKGNVRLVIGELERSSKNATDEEALKALQKLKKLETEALGYQGETTSSFLEFVESFLPKQVGEDEIEQWLKDNVDFSTLKNKMQAVGMVMKHFGQTADGKVVKIVIQERF